LHIASLCISNFRRLRDVRIDMASDISIFVGANNSGKTSVAHAMELFASNSRERFSFHDFSAGTWAAFEAFGDGQAEAALPAISIDIWFHVEPQDLHRVIDLLPSITWTGTTVGLRIEFAASDPPSLLENFRQARERARANIRPGANGEPDYHPPPRTLRDYLSDNQDNRLRREFELRYYVLDRASFNDDLRPAAGYTPRQLTAEKGRSGGEVLSTLLKVDVLHAQRHLSDATGGGRAEDLSRRLSRFYRRNLEKREDDFDTIRVLAQSEELLNVHLARVFEPMLAQLSNLGYPGVSNPTLLIRSALNPSIILSSQDGARVHYALGNAAEGAKQLTLPDRYSGLGYKNLIYMVVELLDRHAQWLDIEENRPPLHLIFIEEPEAHLHAQLQQVFIQKVLDLLALQGADATFYASQVVVTTHSPHVLYERGFPPVRYFRRSETAAEQKSEVLNLSAFYNDTENPTRDFLERYLKLTHCDIFFADAAVLVEGNVERLLLPQMVAKAAPRLQSSYLSILEIGGAFGYRFRTLVEYLRIPTLVITDIDSVTPPAALADGDEDQAEPEDDDDGDAAGSACMTNVAGAVTSNQTLVQWLPQRQLIADLLGVAPEARIQMDAVAGTPLVRVAYQSEVDVVWNGGTIRMAGRTLEEAFALENMTWCQEQAQDDLRLRVRGSANLTCAQLVEGLHRRIKGSKFKKTDFALALLAHAPQEWTVPQYIEDGLKWLEDSVTPTPEPQGGQPKAGPVA